MHEYTHREPLAANMNVPARHVDVHLVGPRGDPSRRHLDILLGQPFAVRKRETSGKLLFKRPSEYINMNLPMACLLNTCPKRLPLTTFVLQPDFGSEHEVTECRGIGMPHEQFRGFSQEKEVRVCHFEVEGCVGRLDDDQFGGVADLRQNRDFGNVVDGDRQVLRQFLQLGIRVSRSETFSTGVRRGVGAGHVEVLMAIVMYGESWG